MEKHDSIIQPSDAGKTIYDIKKQRDIRVMGNQT